MQILPSRPILLVISARYANYTPTEQLGDMLILALSIQRIVAAIFYGGEAFSYHHYSWISILVNVPATLFATGYYELLMRDSLQKIGKGHAVHEDGEEGLALHLTKSGIPMERGTTSTLERLESKKSTV